MSDNDEIGEALDWLDYYSKNSGIHHGAAAAIHLYSRRPNAHGGHLSRPLQPISNRNQILPDIFDLLH
ncbi:hypothetical protein MKX01_016536 [Papaver californicum]|nr:hypothetical protein MKX01_016536 [Papaver californicum]